MQNSPFALVMIGLASCPYSGPFKLSSQVNASFKVCCDSSFLIILPRFPFLVVSSYASLLHFKGKKLNKKKKKKRPAMSI